MPAPSVSSALSPHSLENSVRWTRRRPLARMASSISAGRTLEARAGERLAGYLDVALDRIDTLHDEPETGGELHGLGALTAPHVDRTRLLRKTQRTDQVEQGVGTPGMQALIQELPEGFLDPRVGVIGLIERDVVPDHRLDATAGGRRRTGGLHAIARTGTRASLGHGREARG